MIDNHTSVAPLALDDLDMRLLRVLQQDASMANCDLALQVHASEATCLRRVRRLKERGVIAAQVVLLSAEKIGVGLTAIVEITLERQASDLLDTFEALLAPEPQVQQCYRVSPGPDFILVLAVVDMAAYHALAHRLFTTHENVRNVRTFFSVKRAKFSTAVPL
jgi:Lrp/AsnC family leucine-responsive transcriptional regulator